MVQTELNHASNITRNSNVLKIFMSCTPARIIIYFIYIRFIYIHSHIYRNSHEIAITLT